jgi:hypothetical protein
MKPNISAGATMLGIGSAEIFTSFVKALEME